MRYCSNENVAVYEEAGTDLAPLLIAASETVATHDGYAVVTTALDPLGEGYLVTVYLHDAQIQG